jgi:hypothetical protein
MMDVSIYVWCIRNDVLVLLEEGAPKMIQLDVVKGCMAS